MRPAHADTRHLRARRLRAGAAAALAILVLAVAPVSSAKPTREEIEDARARIDQMHQEIGLLVEEYDQTQVALQQAEAQLAELRAAMREARRTMHRANARLAEAAREAYKGQGSSLGLILSSDSFSVLSDRLYFLDAAARDQADLATRADVAGEQAHRASKALEGVVTEQRALLDRLNQQQAQIEQGIAEQESLVDSLEEELRQQLIEQRQAERAAAEQAAQPPAPSTPSAPDTGSAPNPPVSGSGASAAIAAAESVLGVPYVYGGASPQTGFDCSGLTMWAWAHAGVSLPHSSQMQYASLPHVSRSQLQPGDLVFFYNPISHVALYVGGGMMISAPHTGTVVQRVAVYWEYFTGAARPG
jgi:cell wall-associated NlpC family hydrolase